MNAPLIDCLQDCTVPERLFRQLRAGGVDAIRVEVGHGDFAGMVADLVRWNRRFDQFGDLILRGTEAYHVTEAQETGRVAVFFGLGSPAPLGDDIGLVGICHQLGLRFVPLSDGRQSSLAGGCREAADAGLSRLGRAMVAEMNRVGMVIDTSRAGERATLEAIDQSTRPVAITHANPDWWHPVPRNKSDTVLKALTNSGGMLGLSLHPHALREGTNCRLGDFCEMVAEAADRYGADNLGMGTDLRQARPDRDPDVLSDAGPYRGRAADWRDGSDPDDAEPPDDAPMPDWFRDNRDWDNLRDGLRETGFSRVETEGILGGNWLRFCETGFAAG